MQLGRQLIHGVHPTVPFLLLETKKKKNKFNASIVQTRQKQIRQLNISPFTTSGTSMRRKLLTFFGR